MRAREPLWTPSSLLLTRTPGYNSGPRSNSTGGTLPEDMSLEIKPKTFLSENGPGDVERADDIG